MTLDILELEGMTDDNIELRLKITNHTQQTRRWFSAEVVFSYSSGWGRRGTLSPDCCHFFLLPSVPKMHREHCILWETDRQEPEIGAEETVAQTSSLNQGGALLWCSENWEGMSPTTVLYKVLSHPKRGERNAPRGQASVQGDPVQQICSQDHAERCLHLFHSPMKMLCCQG